MDGMMEIEKFYEKNGNVWTGLAELPSEFQQTIGCPHCRTPISSVNRYGRRIKLSQLESMQKKFFSFCGLQLQRADQIPYREAIKKLTTILEKCSNTHFKKIGDAIQHYLATDGVAPALTKKFLVSQILFLENRSPN